MIPSLVADVFPAEGRFRAILITLNPALVDEMVVLFTPKHSRPRLTLNIPQILSEGTCDVMVKSICLALPPVNNVIKFLLIDIPVMADFPSQFEAHDSTLASRNVLEVIPCTRFGSESFRIDSVNTTIDDTLVKCVFDVRSFILSTPEFPEIGLVLREKHLLSVLTRR
jgi:hypothetical protein